MSVKIGDITIDVSDARAAEKRYWLCLDLDWRMAVVDYGVDRHPDPVAIHQHCIIIRSPQTTAKHLEDALVACMPTITRIFDLSIYDKNGNERWVDGTAERVLAERLYSYLQIRCPAEPPRSS